MSKLNQAAFKLQDDLFLVRPLSKISFVPDAMQALVDDVAGNNAGRRAIPYYLNQQRAGVDLSECYLALLARYAINQPDGINVRPYL